ncbi:hypothetical protein [Aquipseudomonas alcaligenes]|uniref:hypothetical protein n=1 Tax=Aquipseudomonas alcaligenes TaxID=43263 RepID=UPI00242D2195|nr:hypothetical protein [Pseudomonas alcaligenes]
MNINDKSISMVADLIKAKYHPEQYAQEQAEKQAQELAKGKPVFVTDANDPKGQT